MNRVRLAIGSLVLALAGGSAALATPGGNGQHSANSIGSHGKSPRHQDVPPDLGNGRLPPPSTINPVNQSSFAASRRYGRVSYRTGGPNAPGPMTPLIGETSLPFGVAIDAAQGTAVLTLATNRPGHRQVIALTGGEFVVRQRGRNPVTEIILAGGNFAGCPSAGPRAASSAARHRSRRRSRHSVVRSLWARDDHGRFSSYGANSVATVRGTIWLTEDRCDGTLTRVVRGRVAVFDIHLHRTAVVSAGHSYLARSR